VCVAGNEIGDAGAFALARALPQMAQLTTLNLGVVERVRYEYEKLGGASGYYPGILDTALAF
jgi:hypothetical protein